MLFLSSLMRNWINLPSLKVLNNNKPIFLYLFSKDIQVNSEFFNIFSNDNEIRRKIESIGIDCYTQDVTKLPTKYIDNFEVRTVPIVIGILNGEKVGHVLNDGNSDLFISLCDKLESLSKPVESDLVTNLRKLLDHGNLEDLRANLSYLKNNMVRELEVNPTLFNLVSRGTIVSHDNRELNLESLDSDLEKLDSIINEIEVYNLSGRLTGQTLNDHTNCIESLAEKYFNGSNGSTSSSTTNTTNSNTYTTTSSNSNSSSTDKASTTTRNNDKDLGTNKSEYYKNNLKMSYTLKMHIHKLISVKYFLNGNDKESLDNILKAYKLNVKLFQKDIFNLEEYESWDGREVLESLFSIIDSTNTNLMEARTEVENVIGQRNLNEIPSRTKPKGGVVRKHRGYGGRYIWQGMEYRPKKYKPRNLRQYLGENKFIYESNPPSFN